MIFLNKFIFNDGANEGEGGGLSEEQNQHQQNEPNTGELKFELTADELKGFGFSSKDELKSFFEKQKQESQSEDDKKKQSELDELDFKKFSVEKGFAKIEDFEQYNSLTSKEKQSLLFEKHLADFREDNEDVESEETLLELAKDDFNNKYNLNSSSEKAKARGLAKIEKEVKELINPVESKIVEARNNYNDYKKGKELYPVFQQTVLTKVKEHTPDKTVIFKFKNGENEVPIEIDLTEDDRKSIVEKFTNQNNFNKFFVSEDKKAFEAALDAKIQGWVKINKSEQIVVRAVEQGIKIGQAKGSNVGADNPFPLAGGNGVGGASKTLIEQIKESHAKAARV